MLIMMWMMSTMMMILDEWGSMDETIFRGVTSTHENLPSLYSVKQRLLLIPGKP